MKIFGIDALQPGEYRRSIMCEVRDDIESKRSEIIKKALIDHVMSKESLEWVEEHKALWVFQTLGVHMTEVHFPGGRTEFCITKLTGEQYRYEIPSLASYLGLVGE